MSEKTFAEIKIIREICNKVAVKSVPEIALITEMTKDQVWRAIRAHRIIGNQVLRIIEENKEAERKRKLEEEEREKFIVIDFSILSGLNTVEELKKLIGSKKTIVILESILRKFRKVAKDGSDKSKTAQQILQMISDPIMGRQFKTIYYSDLEKSSSNNILEYCEREKISLATSDRKTAIEGYARGINVIFLEEKFKQESQKLMVEDLNKAICTDTLLRIIIKNGKEYMKGKIKLEGGEDIILISRINPSQVSFSHYRALRIIKRNDRMYYIPNAERIFKIVLNKTTDMTRIPDKYLKYISGWV